MEAIVADVHTRGNALTAGDVGYRYLLRALAEGGRSDVIFDINNRSDKPGYGMQLAEGATSLTEAWDADRGASQNHFMLGQIQEWFYHDLAGIQCEPGSAGFKKVAIRPTAVGDLTWVMARYKSVHGLISSEWRRTGDNFSLTIHIPANTTAAVYLPAKSPNNVAENGVPATKASGVKFLRLENGSALFEVVSGTYLFTASEKTY